MQNADEKTSPNSDNVTAKGDVDAVMKQHDFVYMTDLRLQWSPIYLKYMLMTPS